jgi:MFS family permease
MGVPAGTVADRIGAKLAMVIGLALFTVGAFVMSWVSHDGGVATYIVAILFISVGLAFFQTPNNTAVMADARPEQRGLVSGLLALARNLGLITGASLMGALFASVAGDTATSTPEMVTDGMRLAFRIAAAMAAAAFLLSLTTLRPRRHHA